MDETEREYLERNGWRESTRANDPGWWIDPLAQCIALYTMLEAVKLQRKRDA